MITVTKGQWFPLTIGNISYAGAAFDLQGATEVSASLVSTLGAKSPLSFEITAYNEISAVNDGSLSAGKYAIELSCKGSDGKSYRMKSPGAVIKVSSSTTSSTGSTSVRVAGDEWELTADVEMHEGQARTYMSLLEEARKAAMKAADDAEAVIDNVQSSVTQAQEASDAAKSASEAASKAVADTNKAVADTNKALENVTEMEATVNEAESKRAQSEQNRETAEAERVSAEKARAAAEDARKAAETQRETAFASAKGACETATKNATAATDKANTAAEKANASLESKVDYSKMLSDIWVGTAAAYDTLTTKQEGTIYLIDDTTTAGSTTAGSGTVEKMWYGTRNDYDRMTTKDDNVLYMLVEEF